VLFTVHLLIVISDWVIVHKVSAVNIFCHSCIVSKLCVCFMCMRVNNETGVFAGPHTLSVPWNYRLGSVGNEMTGCTTMLASADGEVSSNNLFTIHCICF